MGPNIVNAWIVGALTEAVAIGWGSGHRTERQRNMNLETAIETQRDVIAISSTYWRIKMVEEHADYSARSTAWVGKFQRTKGDFIVNVETPSLATVRAIPASEREVG